MGPVIATIQKQQAKNTVRLPKKTISDPMGIMVPIYVNLAGVQMNAAKRVLTLLSNKSKCDPKMLSNMTELLQTNGMAAVALMFEATLLFYQRGVKSDEQKQKHLHLLEKVFKDISYNIIRSKLQVKIKSTFGATHILACFDCN